jgi:GT2 family glycosyltransferase/spore maturation protein CgeB
MKIFSYIKHYFLLKRNKIFDEKFYLTKYSDIRKADIDPLWHFVTKGYKERRWPNNRINWDDFYNGDYNRNIRELINYYNDYLNSNKIKISCSYNNNNYIFDKNEFKEFPLVSIIVLTRNGEEYIKNLFKYIKENTFYPNFEIIVVDNNSTDNTLKFLKENPYNLKLKIIKNKINKSFSVANNEAVKLAEGTLLVFLNNDVVPLKGWLCELVKEYLNNPNLGSAGSKLIYPEKIGFSNSCKIQHVGIAFRFEGDFYRPYNIGNGENIEKFNKKVKRAALTAACLLVEKNKFLEVEGFDENYIYGYEDVDLGLKLLQKGYENIFVPTSILYHYEFGTQNKDSNEEIKNRRLNNIRHFQKKWHIFLKKKYWKEKINNKNFLFSEKPLHIAFAVSNKGKNVAEGDYFTALELGEEFKKFGWRVTYLSRRHNEWYNLSEDIDILITLIDSYDLRKIKSVKKVITIAWARNWFDRWVKNESFNYYDFVFASSKKACDYIKKYSQKEAILFPIATNANKFTNKIFDKNFECDYCFTGSYWNDKRDIIEKLNPSKLPFKFHIYGKNWDKFDKFKPYFKGFVPYEDIPKVYSNTKIVIDDANRVTKPFGSVNSRVFDALASGVLVITNGKLGSLELFEGKLPYYETKEELESLLKLYLNNENLRREKVKELKNIVLTQHTYAKRAEFFKQFLIDIFLKKSIVINVPVPKWDVAKEWGDYYFGKSLKKYFERKGYRVLLQILPQWEEANLYEDVILVLRGLNRYNLKNYHFNVMWNISHPDKIGKNEYDSYDFVYIASNYWSKHVKKVLNNSEKIAPLLQCTDSEIFKHIDIEEDIDILFVGNSRNVFRKIIKDLLPIKYNVYIYGTLWEKFIDLKYIKGKNIPNEELYKYYNRAKIILNDHWKDMKEKGFISNRIFDVSACKKFVLTDEVKGLEEIFGNSIVSYDGTREDLLEKIDLYIYNKSLRMEKAAKAQEIVLKYHTFDKRVNEIDRMLKNRCYYEK